MHIEALRVENVQRRLEAEAVGIEAKADALKKYNESATFLELARLHIEAERDIHIDQAKAMGTALTGAHIRMYGGDGGTVDNIRQLFTSGFGIGEALEGVAQSLPEGLRDRLARDGIRGIFRRPDDGPLSGHVGHVADLVEAHLGDALDTPFAAGARTAQGGGGRRRAGDPRPRGAGLGERGRDVRRRTVRHRVEPSAGARKIVEVRVDGRRGAADEMRTSCSVAVHDTNRAVKQQVNFRLRTGRYEPL